MLAREPSLFACKDSPTDLGLGDRARYFAHSPALTVIFPILLTRFVGKADLLANC